MNNKCLIVIVLILGIIAIISGHNNKTTIFNDELIISVKDENNIISDIDLENYVIGVVAGEMPASFNEEALKAQAIAARSFAVNKINNSNGYYDVFNDNRSQVYITIDDMHSRWKDSFDKYYKKIEKAVMDTKGQVMKYNDEIITAYYFAISNGKTEDVSLVFGGTKEYLISMDSSWDKNIKNYEVTKTITKEEFSSKLNIASNSIEIGKINYSDSGRVNTIVINNKVFKGTEIRKLLGLRSTDFNIEIGNDIKITTRGYGHGVGMSQYGANEMAKMGYKYEDILKYYYQNVSISKI